MDILEQFLRLVVVGEFFLLLLWMLASFVCMYVCIYVLQEEAFVFLAKKKKKKKKLSMCEEAQASWRLRLATTCMP